MCIRYILNVKLSHYMYKHTSIERLLTASRRSGDIYDCISLVALPGLITFLRSRLLTCVCVIIMRHAAEGVKIKCPSVRKERWYGGVFNNEEGTICACPFT